MEKVKLQQLLQKQKQYINSFGLNGTGATIQVSEGSDIVTIVLPGEAQDVTIGNLK